MKSRGNAGNGKADRPWRLPQGMQILYEDGDLIVVFKPAGLLSVAAGGEKNRTAYWILNEYLRRRGIRQQVAVVHRLDRDTSGVMLFAKSAAMKKALMDNWDELVLERHYVAVVEGSVTDKEGTIDIPLAEDARGRVVPAPSGRGQRAVTHWNVLRSGSRYSLLSLELETGRRNQIRVHCAAIGHPVAGDEKYGSRSNPLGRLGLHAEQIKFIHPRTREVMDFSVPAPSNFTAVIQ
ncbi:RluA family pseudouridine synthase [Gracilinema caldarium]|uniref:RluA family pseudouridine synthase n=1 Tax=Gracilinema caldarium TaxID=215591 RepID=UPI0026ECCEC3|nr:RluA family pseudouridine synthase [Gracilinema caldarium]